jgi:hypothetical protein
MNDICSVRDFLSIKPLLVNPVSIFSYPISSKANMLTQLGPIMNEIALTFSRVNWIPVIVGVFAIICGAFSLKSYIGPIHKSWISSLPKARLIESNTTQSIMDARDQVCAFTI